jgi:hypothetical protein
MKEVLQKIRRDNRKFITSKEIEQHCNEMYINYKLSSDYLISRGYLVQILENIYYIKSSDEYRENKIKFSLLELVGKSLGLGNVKNWYFGLYTAFNLNKVNYNHKDEMFYIINDHIRSNIPIKILGKKFRFLKFKDSLLKFGIINNKINYSNHEKTILDLLYLWDSNHKNENRVLVDLAKLLNGTSKEKIIEYSQYYPVSIQQLIQKAIA